MRLAEELDFASPEWKWFVGVHVWKMSILGNSENFLQDQTFKESITTISFYFSGATIVWFTLGLAIIFDVAVAGLLLFELETHIFPIKIVTYTSVVSIFASFSLLFFRNVVFR